MCLWWVLQQFSVFVVNFIIHHTAVHMWLICTYLLSLLGIWHVHTDLCCYFSAIIFPESRAACPVLCVNLIWFQVYMLAMEAGDSAHISIVAAAENLL